MCFALLVVLLAVSLTVAEEAAVDGMKQRPDYRQLVAGLVSPNRPIECGIREETLGIPPRFDWKAQEQIEKNRCILFDHCDEALLFLREGCTDTRYSLTSPWAEGAIYSSCVGEVCLEIVAHHVEVFRDHMSFSSWGHWHRYDFIPLLFRAMGEKVTEEKKCEIREWWQTHTGKSLRELQIEAFDWAIANAKEELKRFSHEPNAKDEASEASEAARNIQSLIAGRNKLMRSTKCLPPMKMWPSILSPDGYRTVPWIGREK